MVNTLMMNRVVFTSADANGEAGHPNDAPAHNEQGDVATSERKDTSAANQNPNHPPLKPMPFVSGAAITRPSLAAQFQSHRPLGDSPVADTPSPTVAPMASLAPALHAMPAPVMGNPVVSAPAPTSSAHMPVIPKIRPLAMKMHIPVLGKQAPQALLRPQAAIRQEPVSVAAFQAPQEGTAYHVPEQEALVQDASGTDVTVAVDAGTTVPDAAAEAPVAEVLVATDVTVDDEEPDVAEDATRSLSVAEPVPAPEPAKPALIFDVAEDVILDEAPVVKTADLPAAHEESLEEAAADLPPPPTLDAIVKALHSVVQRYGDEQVPAAEAEALDMTPAPSEAVVETDSVDAPGTVDAEPEQALSASQQEPDLAPEDTKPADLLTDSTPSLPAQPTALMSPPVVRPIPISTLSPSVSAPQPSASPASLSSLHQMLPHGKRLEAFVTKHAMSAPVPKPAKAEQKPVSKPTPRPAEVASTPAAEPAVVAPAAPAEARQAVAPEVVHPFGQNPFGRPEPVTTAPQSGAQNHSEEAAPAFESKPVQFHAEPAVVHPVAEDKAEETGQNTSAEAGIATENQSPPPFTAPRFGTKISPAATGTLNSGPAYASATTSGMTFTPRPVLPSQQPSRMARLQNLPRAVRYGGIAAAIIAAHALFMYVTSSDDASQTSSSQVENPLAEPLLEPVESMVRSPVSANAPAERSIPTPPPPSAMPPVIEAPAAEAALPAEIAPAAKPTATTQAAPKPVDKPRVEAKPGAKKPATATTPVTVRDLSAQAPDSQAPSSATKTDKTVSSDQLLNLINRP